MSVAMAGGPTVPPQTGTSCGLRSAAARPAACARAAVTKNSSMNERHLMRSCSSIWPESSVVCWSSAD
eukprot:870071-Pleurochrysis_carterae.AAC.5